MPKDPLYEAAVFEVAQAMHAIVCQMEKSDPQLSALAKLESGKLKSQHGDQVVAIDVRCEQIIEQFHITEQELEDDIAQALAHLEMMHLPFLGQTNITVH